MSGLDVWLSGKIGSEHRKIVGDDRVEFLVSPGFPDLFVISHGLANILPEEAAHGTPKRPKIAKSTQFDRIGAKKANTKATAGASTMLRSLRMTSKKTKARTNAKTKATAGPSTPFGAKNAPNSAQDDRFVEMRSFVRCSTIITSAVRADCPLQ
jgi:hypothetical protein